MSEQNLGGAPIGNANRLRSGKRAWCAIKRLPKGSEVIGRKLYAERDDVTEAVMSQHGEVSLYHSALVQSAIRHSGRAQLLERWLRTEGTLSLTERLAVLKEIGSATDSRDKCLKLAGLDAKASVDIWGALVSPMLPTASETDGHEAASRTTPWTEHPTGDHEVSTSGPTVAQRANCQERLND